MTAPVVRQFPGTIPDKGQSQTTFDTNVDAFLDWQALQFAPDLVAFGTFASDTAAALVAANLPSLTGRALDAVRVNAAADGVEFANVTAAGWALLDDADTAAQRATLGVQSGAEVTAGGVGSYALLQEVGDNRTARSLGSTADGSLLRFAAISGTGAALTKGNAASGTWRLMGEYATFSSSNDNPTSLWFRIS
jgi:hypothetical protein